MYKFIDDFDYHKKIAGNGLTETMGGHDLTL